MPVVGKPLPRVDAYEKVTGKARYVDDLKFQGELVVKILQSEKAHARILSIDTSEAEAVPRVSCVLTAKDIPGKNRIPLVFQDMPFLADSVVRYCGESVAVVVAETAQAAREALKKIKVEYEPLEFSLSIPASLEEDAPKIFSDNNIFRKFQVIKGDVETAFREADIVIENIYETGYQEHAYIETQGMVAIPDREGSISVYGSMQCPFYIHDAVAQCLGIPHNRVRIVQMTTGGGFGGKEDIPSLLAALASVAAMRTGKPCRLILSREEDIVTMSKRHPSLIKYKTAAAKDGTLLGVDVEYYLDGGAYATLSPIVLWRGTVHAVGPYECPNVRVRSWAVATNKVPCGAFRGFGSPQILFASESQMDILAHQTGKDPLDVRAMNALQEGGETCTGQALEGSFGLGEVMETAAKRAKWLKVRKKFREFNADPVNYLKRGIGISTIFYGVGLGAGGKKIERAGAFVQVHKDGTVSVAVGTTELGQGMRTVLCQIAAEEFGLPLSDVHMLDVDTTRVPDSGPTVASRSTLMSGNAIIDACSNIKAEMLPIAALRLDCAPEDIAFEDGRVFIEKTPDSHIPFTELVEECVLKKVHLVSQGWSLGPYTSFNEENGQGHCYMTYAYAANIAEVEVDTRTGEVTVLKITAAHDVGKAINPQTVEGQIEGGSIQGMGYGIMEEIIHDSTGRILTPNLSTYVIPTAMDVPEIDPIIVEAEFENGPYGAKGFGEQPLMGVAPAIANAVFDACGARICSLPVSPERIIEALEPNHDPNA